MEELRPEDIEDLLQELEEEDETREPLPPDVEELLNVLQAGSHYLPREAAAKLLGNVETGDPRIVRALIAASGSDPHLDVRGAAAKSLRAPVHQEYLQKHPDLAEATERALQQAPGTGETGRGVTERDTSLIRCLKWNAVAGLVVGLVIGVWQAGQALSPGGGPGGGVVFLIALTAGAVVGAVVGAAVQEREDRSAGTILGAIVAGVVASLSWFPMQICRILQLGGL